MHWSMAKIEVSDCERWVYLSIISGIQSIFEIGTSHIERAFRVVLDIIGKKSNPIKIKEVQDLIKGH